MLLYPFFVSSQLTSPLESARISGELIDIDREEKMNDDHYYPDMQPSTPQNNTLALTSIIAGLGGWLLAIIFVCLSFAV